MSGLPKWFTAFNPVNIDVLDSRWKWFSQMYSIVVLIELVEELCDEDVYLQYIGDVLALHVAKYVDEPLEVFV